MRMGEHDFQSDVIDRLARIEEQLRQISVVVNGHDAEITDMKETAVIARQSAKSAHHRIDYIYIIAGSIAAAVSFVINYFKGQ